MTYSASAYVINRWNLKGLRTRPQAVAWSDNYGTLSGGFYVPDGEEWVDYMILSDHNRSEISVSYERIENRKRMIDGKMRSYHTADKCSFSWNWDLIPSRAYDKQPEYFTSGVRQGKISNMALAHTYDGGAGGVEILDWYENHKGPFYMLLAYDKYTNFPQGVGQYNHLSQYNDVKQVYFSKFDKEIVKRAGLNFDFWTISVSLEEV